MHADDRTTLAATIGVALAVLFLLYSTLLSSPLVLALDGTATVTGPAKVLDGDTLDIGTTRVRLFGIDAPESAQRCIDQRSKEWACGRSATRALERLTKGQEVTCRGDSRDVYGRLLAVCSTGSGEINASLVRQGLAWAFVKYSDAYRSGERLVSNYLSCLRVRRRSRMRLMARSSSISPVSTKRS